MKSEEEVWRILEADRDRLLHWAGTLERKLDIHAIHFVPIDAKQIEVYIFFPDEKRRRKYRWNGSSRAIKKQFCELLNASGIGPKNGVAVRFEFDSHENVVENYEGSYFFRLR